MGRNARRRAEQKAAIKRARAGNGHDRDRGSVHRQEPTGQVRANGPVILWGVPGAGKSTFARWLRDTRGYVYVDNDQVAKTLASRPPDSAWAALTPMERAWTALTRGRISPEAFIRAAVEVGRPVVVEYGMFANQAGVDGLRQLREQGAEPWWFDGDRQAAKDAWREENHKSSRPFVDGDWDRVVGVIEANWAMLTDFFGPRILRTVEPGPAHLEPEEIQATMTAIVVPVRA
jgi:predicted kinase